METLLGRSLDGLAGLVHQKWFAGMGLLGLVLFCLTLFVEPVGDAYATRCVLLMMFGWGFGQAECRTFRQRVGGGMKITSPAWRLTVSGAILFLIAFGAAVALAIHWT